MPLVQVRVAVPATQSATDGNDYNVLGGKQQEMIVSELHGKYYSQAVRGNVFHASTVVAGVAIPISTATAPIVGLWNPSGSGKNAVLIRYSASYVSGTTVAGALGLSLVSNAGAALGTAAPFSAFANGTVTNALIGGGGTNQVRACTGGTTTLTTAGTWFYTLGFQEYAAVATTAIAPAAIIHDFDGMLIVPPNTFVHVVGSAASGALLSQTLSWEEVPT